MLNELFACRKRQSCKSAFLLLSSCSHSDLTRWRVVEAIDHYLALSQFYYETQTNSWKHAPKLPPLHSCKPWQSWHFEKLVWASLQKADSHLGCRDILLFLKHWQARCPPDSDQIFLFWLDASSWLSALFHQRLASLPLVVVVMEVWISLGGAGCSLGCCQGVV